MYKLYCVLLMALVTYLPRMLPIAIFRKKINSRFIQSFLRYVPFAVLSALTIPDIFTSTGNYGTATCGTLVAILLAYLEQNLVVVASGAILTVFIAGCIF